MSDDSVVATLDRLSARLAMRQRNRRNRAKTHQLAALDVLLFTLGVLDTTLAGAGPEPASQPRLLRWIAGEPVAGVPFAIACAQRVIYPEQVLMALADPEGPPLVTEPADPIAQLAWRLRSAERPT